MPHRAPAGRAAAARWPLQPHLVEGEEDKFRAFKLAHAALAASGTVTLELALAGTPMVVAYRVDPLAAPFLRRLIKAPSMVLANLVLGRERVSGIPSRSDCTPENLADALEPLLATRPSAARSSPRWRAFPHMQIESGSPSEAAAEIVFDYAAQEAAGRENGRHRELPAVVMPEIVATRRSAALIDGTNSRSAAPM